MRRALELFASATRLYVAAGVAVALASGSLQAQAPPACASDSSFAWLDFWIGTWDVFAGEQQAGENRIQKIVGGCAVTEEWTSTAGQRGHSLFYFRPGSRTWHQVWVTERALAPGGLKEKELIDRLPDGALRFQGEIPLAGGGTYLDRTTLTPLGTGEVRQLIEISTDGGGTWRTVFDARYVRRR